MSDIMHTVVWIGIIALAVASVWRAPREPRSPVSIIEARRVPGRADTWQA